MLVTGDYRKALNGLGFSLSERARFIGYENDGALVALAAFDEYDGTDIEVHVMANGFPRAWIRAICVFVFETCGCRRMTSLNSSKNFQMQPYLERLGFKHEGTKRNALPDADLIIYGMTKEDCQWVEKPKPQK